MQFILHLIQKHRTFLLFLVLELFALLLTLQYQSYQKSKFINSANFLSGGIYNNVTSFRDYLHLKEENEILLQQNSNLKNQLLKRSYHPAVFKDSLHSKFAQKFKYTPARIINNDFHKRNNFLTLNVGSKDSVGPDMAVLNAKGIIGITANTSANYSTAISALNTRFKVNARLKNNDYFGTVSWNGKSPEEAQLIDIPRQALLIVGDTIVTGGRSSIFPEGILIGSIATISYENNRFKEVNIKLFNDIRNVTNVFVVKNLERNEIKELEKLSNE